MTKCPFCEMEFVIGTYQSNALSHVFECMGKWKDSMEEKLGITIHYQKPSPTRTIHSAFCGVYKGMMFTEKSNQHLTQNTKEVTCKECKCLLTQQAEE